MDALTLLDIERATNVEMKPRVPNITVELTRGYRLALKWDEMFARYVITLSKFSISEIYSNYVFQEFWQRYRLPISLFFSDVSYLSDDLLLTSRIETGLSNMDSHVSTSFSDIGISCNVDKCEILSFNDNSSTSLRCSGFTIPLVDSLRWLGISITNTLASLRQRTVSDINKKI